MFSKPYPGIGDPITGVESYQMYHGLALIAVAWACIQWPEVARMFQISGFLFLIGVASFSGSLYVMALTGMNLGYLTPFGGLAFIVGWLTMAIGAFGNICEEWQVKM
jgi:uncharacterized membrane protein YgdD (TMEM256/DUF423 family)